MQNDLMKTVVETMAEQCLAIRRAGMPLIMVDTFDIELVGEIALACGIVTPIKQRRYSAAHRDSHYFDFLTAEREGIRDYGNFFDTWLPLTQREGKPFDIRQMTPGMYILPLGAETWMQRSGEGDHRISRLREYVREFVNSVDPNSPVCASCILLYGDSKFLPDDLMGYTAIVEEEYPEKREIRNILTQMTAEAGVPLDEEVVQDLMKDLSGFGRGDVCRRIRGLLCADDIAGKAAVLNREFRKQSILSAKKQVLLQNGGILELQVPGKKNNALAGMGAYQDWVSARKAHMTDFEQYKLERGILPPKGVLMCGVPGCGKSEAAKILQTQWDGIPMVKLNIDALMGGVVGESEKNLRTALRQAEAMAPCIVWIDELEKGFSGATGKQSGDSGTFKRMFGRLLSWMQDNQRPCFLFATSNDISRLPPEFFRKGRFDELFAVFMPTHQECKEIFREQMRRAETVRQIQARELGTPLTHPLFEKDCDSEDNLNDIMAALTEEAEQVKFVSGADITEIVKRALMEVPVNKAITPGEWRNAVKAVIRSGISTQGSSYANLNSIAACYLRLLRGSFVPASREDQVLLRAEDYRVKWDEEAGKPVASYRGTKPENPYDKALYTAIVTRINRFAGSLENNEQMSLVM